MSYRSHGQTTPKTKERHCKFPRWPFSLGAVSFGVPFIVLIALAALLFSALAASADSAQGFEFFERRIRPIFVEHCFKCHSAESEKLKGGLRLDTKDALRKGGESGLALVPGDPETSLLIKAVRYGDEELQMPPKTKLSDAQIADLVEWVRMGAPDPREEKAVAKARDAAKNHWAFQKVRKHPLPEVANQSWAQTPIDCFILAKLEAEGLSPAAPADKRTLLRRASYDLTGLPPTAGDLAAFETDPSDKAFARVVERLLDSPHYGERWGRHWLDLARYADTKGYVYTDREESQFVHSHVYRDWVIRAFNKDLPYDQFLMQQIAGDQIEGGQEIESPLAAMGFLTVGRRFLGVSHDIIDDRIDVLTKATQGLTVSCARCHDHKFDPIPIDDYYSLYGVFAASIERTVGLEANPAPTKEYEAFKKGYNERAQKLQESFQKRKEDLLARVRKQTPQYLLAVLDADTLPTEEFYEIRGPDDLNPTIVRQWQAYLYQTSKSFHPVLAPWHEFAKIPKSGFAQKAEEAWIAFKGSAGEKLNPVVVQRFSTSLPKSMEDLARSYGEIFAEVNKKHLELQQPKKESEQQGEPLTAAEEQIRDVLYSADSPITVPTGSVWDMEWFFDEAGRVEFGKLQSEIDRWIIKSPGAPKFAVTLADRASLRTPRVFRRGNPANKGDEVPRQYLALVEGPGRKPFEKGSGRLELARAIANPENPFTARVMVNRVWANHFGEGLVKTLNDFGTRSEAPSHPELLDWLANYFVENGWSVKKLNRLIMLSSVYQQRSENSDSAKARQRDPENRLLWRMNRHRLEFEELRDSLLMVSGGLDLTAGGKPVPLFGKNPATRRSMYGFIDRQFLPGVFRVFDFPNPDLPSAQRSLTTVPQQALYLMNNRFLVERARAFATLSKEQASEDPAGRIRWMYRNALQREPRAEEMRAGLDYIRVAESLPLPEPPPPPPPPAWSYGYGEVKEGKVLSFKPLPFFGDDSWQGGANWPDAKLGWVRLTAEGGHAGNDLQHAAIRRWTASADGKLSIAATLEHKHPEGDGIHAAVISSRAGILGEWNLHNSKTKTEFDPVPVKKGETIDFVVDIRAGLNNDDFLWAPKLKLIVESTAPYDKTEWDAKKEFAGPPDIPPPPLKPWESYAQALLMSNEFVFID